MPENKTEITIEEIKSIRESLNEIYGEKEWTLEEIETQARYSRGE